MTDWTDRHLDSAARARALLREYRPEGQVYTAPNAAVALLRALLDALERERGGWVSVEERLPPSRTPVWALNRNGVIFKSVLCVGMHKPFFTFPRGWKDASDTYPSWIDVTHWTAADGRPLPAPPGEQPPAPQPWGREPGATDLEPPPEDTDA